MYAKYDSAFYYKNPEIQLIINLQRVKDELDGLLEIDHCDRCMGLKCKCLDVATVDADTAANDRTDRTAHTTDTNDKSTKTAEATTARKVTSTAWSKDVNKDTKTTWFKDLTKDVKVAKDAKWSFKFSPLDIEEDIWRRADRHGRRLEEKYLTSETVEEFFQCIRKRAVKCS